MFKLTRSAQILFVALLAGNSLFTKTVQGKEATSREMSQEIMNLWPGTAPGSEGISVEEKHEKRVQGQHFDVWVTQVSQPTLEVYLPPAENRTGTGVVICPGGGYGGLSMHKEGHALAAWFAERGVVAGVLKYRVAPFKHPVPLNDAQRALRIMHSRAHEWQLEPEQIGIAGFSAGGHLASTVGTHYDEGNAAAEDPIERASCRPYFMVLVYPVITLEVTTSHRGSRKNLIGNDPTPELIEQLSNEKHVTAETGQTFLVHASDDQVVPVENCMMFYQALNKHKVPAELHIYEVGGHGFGFLRGDRPVDNWTVLLEGWLKRRGLLGGDDTAMHLGTRQGRLPGCRPHRTARGPRLPQ